MVPTNESEDKIPKYEELWIKITDSFRSVTENLDDYDEKNMRIKFDTDDKLPLKEILKIPIIKIVFRAVFHGNNKYYPQGFRWMSEI